MRVWQKIIIGLLSTVLVAIVGGVAYGTIAMKDVKDTADAAYQPVERQIPSLREDEVDYSNADPFSILLLGVDTDEMRPEDPVGRSDSIMVVTINPKKKQTTMVSIPRDTYTELLGGSDTNGSTDSGTEVTIASSGYYDKINHAYAYGGVAMSMASIEKLLDIPIDHYAMVNMDGMTQLVDAVGGVTIDNELEFDYEGASFPLGKIHLAGWEAVKYSRMRYDDPEGDYGRQERQRIVLEAVFDKLVSIDSLTNYKKILEVMGDNAQTDLSWDTIVTMLKKYTPALTDMETDQLQGYDFTGDGMTGEYGVSYQMIESSELTRIQNLLKEQLEK